MSIRLNDVGTRIEVIMYDVQTDPTTETVTKEILDISSSTVREIILRKPNGEIVTKDAVFGTDGTDGVMYFLTIAEDLDQANTWLLQGRVEMPAGKWSSTLSEFTVEKNLWI